MQIEKLSDITPIKAFSLNEDELTNYVFCKNRIEIDTTNSYDVGIVLGCSNYKIMNYRINEAIHLYQTGIINTIILSGGCTLFNRHDNAEAYIMYNYLIKNGINSNDIILEEKSKNTIENMKNSVSIIENDYKNIDSIVIITSDFHIKRSKGILKNLTDIDIFTYGVLDGKHDHDNWMNNSFYDRHIIRKEAYLLSYYVHNKTILDQPINNLSLKLIKK